MPIYNTGKKKNGIAQYRVTYNYTDGSGKYRQKSKTVCGYDNARLAEKELSLKFSGAKGSYGLTVDELLKIYLNSKSHEVRESTLEKSRRILNHHIIPHLGKAKLDKLTPAVLQEWKNQISEKDLKIRTKKNIYKELSAMLNYAVKVDYLQSNPLAKVGNFKDPYSFEDELPEEKLQYYTPEEFKAFINAAKQHLNTLKDYGYYAFFNIAFYTGMRKGEINALKWSDIDFKNATLSVKRSVTQKLKGQKEAFTPPKNPSSVRKLKLPKPLMAVLEEQLEIQKKNTTKWNKDMLVCGGANCLSDTAIENHNKQFADEAGLPKIRIHDFRHTHATVLINEGISIQEISRRLGHSDVTITWKVYAHLYPREEDRAINILDNI